MRFHLRNGIAQAGRTIRISATIETGLPIPDKTAGVVNATDMHSVEEFRFGIARGSEPLFVNVASVEIAHIRQASAAFLLARNVGNVVCMPRLWMYRFAPSLNVLLSTWLNGIFYPHSAR